MGHPWLSDRGAGRWRAGVSALAAGLFLAALARMRMDGMGPIEVGLIGLGFWFAGVMFLLSWRRDVNLHAASVVLGAGGASAGGERDAAGL